MAASTSGGCSVGFLSMSREPSTDVFFQRVSVENKQLSCQFVKLSQQDLQSYDHVTYGQFDAVVLLHSVLQGRNSVTDVADARYNKLLPRLKQLYGANRVCVVVYSLKSFNANTKNALMMIFRQSQPTTFKCSNCVIQCDQLGDMPHADLDRMIAFLKNAPSHPLPKPEPESPPPTSPAPSTVSPSTNRSDESKLKSHSSATPPSEVPAKPATRDSEFANSFTVGKTDGAGNPKRSKPEKAPNSSSGVQEGSSVDPPTVSSSERRDVSHHPLASSSHSQKPEHETGSLSSADTLASGSSGTLDTQRPVPHSQEMTKPTYNSAYPGTGATAGLRAVDPVASGSSGTLDTQRHSHHYQTTYPNQHYQTTYPNQHYQTTYPNQHYQTAYSSPYVGQPAISTLALISITPNTPLKQTLKTHLPDNTILQIDNNLLDKNWHMLLAIFLDIGLIQDWITDKKKHIKEYRSFVNECDRKMHSPGNVAILLNSSSSTPHGAPGMPVTIRHEVAPAPVFEYSLRPDGGAQFDDDTACNIKHWVEACCWRLKIAGPKMPSAGRNPMSKYFECVII